MAGQPNVKTDWKALRATFSADWKAAEEAVTAARLARKGDLYFIRAGDAVKIGYTVDITKRLRKMRVDNPCEVDCLLLLRGCGHLEREWHNRFRHCHIRGEWFKFEPELERALIDARREQSKRVI